MNYIYMGNLVFDDVVIVSDPALIMNAADVLEQSIFQITPGIYSIFGDFDDDGNIMNVHMNHVDINDFVAFTKRSRVTVTSDFISVYNLYNYAKPETLFDFYQKIEMMMQGEQYCLFSGNAPSDCGLAFNTNKYKTYEVVCQYNEHGEIDRFSINGVD